MENILIPRNLEGRKEKRKQMNIKLLSQEVIDGDLILDGSFMNIDTKFVKIKKVNGTVWLTGRQWTEIPEWLKDVEITGSFTCSFNKIKTLKNCTQKIGGTFSCANNKLISLKGCPKEIGGDFWCYNNLLTSLEGCPKNIERSFYCDNNLLTSLEGCSKNIQGIFSCNYNRLSSLEGCPNKIGRSFYCHHNAIKLELPDYVELKGQFNN